MKEAIQVLLTISGESQRQVFYANVAIEFTYDPNVI